jgi:Tfp pilus assembly protein PilN
MKGEINLLPQEIALRRERRACLAGVGRLLQRLSFLLVVLIVGEIIVYVSFMYVDRELEKVYETQGEGNSITSKVKRVNQMLAQVERTKDEYINWSLYIEEVLNNAPPGVKIRRIQVKDEEGILELEGFSSSRGAVLDFQNLLKELSWVVRVEAPLQNYALGTDAGFSFNIIVTEEKQ